MRHVSAWVAATSDLFADGAQLILDTFSLRGNMRTIHSGCLSKLFALVAGSFFAPNHACGRGLDLGVGRQPSFAADYTALAFDEQHNNAVHEPYNLK
jgi:hypothetical protein